MKKLIRPFLRALHLAALSLVGLVALLLLLAPRLVFAQDVTGAPPELAADVTQLADVVLRAVASGDWQLIAAAAVVLIVWLARKFGTAYVPWLGTKWGGIALAFGTSAAGMLLTAVMAGHAITARLALAAVLTGLTAIGSFSTGKNIAEAKKAGAEAAGEVKTSADAVKVLGAGDA